MSSYSVCSSLAIYDHFMRSLRTKLLFLLMLELHLTSFNNKLYHGNMIENTQVNIFKRKEIKER